METLLIALILVGAVWSVVASISIGVFLKERGHEINFLWYRVYFFKYVSQYRQITQEESGRVGPLVYHMVVPLLVALAAAIALAVTKNW